MLDLGSQRGFCDSAQHNTSTMPVFLCISALASGGVCATPDGNSVRQQQVSTAQHHGTLLLLLL
jgi:hypothetical protein